ncbi:MAG TPA: cyclic nucleotide-binding domain-containing protein [Thermoanaerobaculia bacterium]|nr:cyclic nucleotide-binding domain-containing protein [Thermoanaerobaculia bacterium]
MSDPDDASTRTDGPTPELTSAETKVWRQELEEELHELIEQVLPTPDGRLLARRKLGRGGMAEVEVALDVALQRRVAKKLLLPRLRGDAFAVRLFLREAQITAQLDHPAIVPVHELGLDPGGRLYFTMKLVAGATFTAWTRDLPTDALEAHHLQDLVEIVVRLCDALAFAHDRGVIHGDVKPDNVMVGAFGEVYLMDWGLARLEAGASTRTSDALRAGDGESAGGSPAFMAPEQARGGALDARTDVFALGALLYYALAGCPPYQADTALRVLAKAREARYQPLAARAGREAPPELERIVARAMAPEPEDRFPTAAALRDELKAFQRGGAEYPIREVARGDHIIREGESGHEVYILASGRVEVYRTIDDERVSLREMGPGEVFGEMAILTSSPRTASVVALEDCVLRVITGELLDREIHGLKPWMATLTRALAHRLLEEDEDR